MVRNAAATPRPSINQWSGDAKGRDDVRAATLSNRSVPVCSSNTVYANIRPFFRSRDIHSICDIFFQCVNLHY
jgi:hypothetical protein